jgi:hypothetical protein
LLPSKPFFWGTSSGAEVLRQHQRVLEQIFPKGWFSKRRLNHPAYQRWKWCDDLLMRGGSISYPSQEPLLPQLGRIILDSSVFVILTEGNLAEVKPGCLKSYGDPLVQSFLRSRLPDRHQFEDVMVELAFGAWHKGRGHRVSPLEVEGHPDLEIGLTGIAFPVLAECKRLSTASENRIKNILRKANSQIRVRQAECYGVAVLDVSNVVNAGCVDDDLVPATLQSVAQVVKSALQRQNRAVGAALLLWDDYMTVGTPPQPTLVVFRRRHLMIRHQAPERAIPERALLFEGYSTGYWVLWERKGGG